MSGTIFSYLADRGYGFIRLDDGRHVFFHISDAFSSADKMIAGKEVVFALCEYPCRGVMKLKATNVQVL